MRALPGLLFRLICCGFFNQMPVAQKHSTMIQLVFFSFFCNNSFFGGASESEVLKDPFSASLDAATSDLAGKETSQLGN